MQIGVDSFVAATGDAAGRAIDPARHLSELLEAITLADEVGLDVFGIGEHHRHEFLDSAPTMILAAARGPNKTYSPDKRRHGIERSRSGTRVPGVRDA